MFCTNSAQCFQTLGRCNLQRFMVGQSVFHSQRFQALSNVAGKAGAYLSEMIYLSGAPLLGRLLPYPQILGKAFTACKDKHSSLLRTFVNYNFKSFMTLTPSRFCTAIVILLPLS
jgi:hypothetical protein